MNDIAMQISEKLREALPEATILWEKEPLSGLKGGVLSAELKQRKLTLQFDSRAEDDSVGADCVIVEDVVDDFVDFFENSIYRREKFTRFV